MLQLTANSILRRLLHFALYLRNFNKAPKQQLPPNTGGYYHRLFQKDAPHLLKQMVEGKGTAGEPNMSPPEPAVNQASAAKAPASKKARTPSPPAEQKPPSPKIATSAPIASSHTDLSSFSNLASASHLQGSAQNDSQTELEALQNRSAQLAAEREALMQSMLAGNSAGAGGLGGLGGGFGGFDQSTLDLLRQRQQQLGGDVGSGTGAPAGAGDFSALDILRQRRAGNEQQSSLEQLFRQRQNEEQSALEQFLRQRQSDEHQSVFEMFRQRQAEEELLRQRQSTMDIEYLLEQRRAALEAENSLAEQQRAAALEMALAERATLERGLGGAGGYGGGGLGGYDLNPQDQLSLQLAQLRGQQNQNSEIDPSILHALRQQQEGGRGGNAGIEELLLLEQQRRQQAALQAFMYGRGL